MRKTVLTEISSCLTAMDNCKRAGNDEWFTKHEERLDDLILNRLPRGSGFDAGTEIDMDKTTAQRIVFTTSFHHMNGNGYYDGWTEHTVIVTPAFNGFDVRVTGKDRNDIKAYITEMFHNCLGVEIEERKNPFQEAKEVVEHIQRYVNSMSRTPDDFCTAMSNLHKTNQQDFTRLVMAWLKHLADAPDHMVDGRNTYSRELARQIFSTVDYLGLPNV